MFNFKIWDKGLNCFVDNSDKHEYYSSLSGKIFKNHFCDNKMLRQINALSLKSTELLSEDGEEIYEGDICVFILEEGGETISYDIGVIKFNNAAFILDGSSFDKDTHYLGDYLTQENKAGIKILGNIYENPEMLKK